MFRFCVSCARLWLSTSRMRFAEIIATQQQMLRRDALPVFVITVATMLAGRLTSLSQRRHQAGEAGPTRPSYTSSRSELSGEGGEVGNAAGTDCV